MPQISKTHVYKVHNRWTGNKGVGTQAYNSYARDHELTMDGKSSSILASSDVAFRGDRTRYNPEELLVSALSSCHMLAYLHLCATAGIVVTTYIDNAVGTMQETPEGSGRFESATLHPVVEITDASRQQEAETLHHKAHEMCFIANSVNFPVDCVPTILPVAEA